MRNKVNAEMITRSLLNKFSMVRVNKWANENIFLWKIRQLITMKRVNYQQMDRDTQETKRSINEKERKEFASIGLDLCCSLHPCKFCIKMEQFFFLPLFSYVTLKYFNKEFTLLPSRVNGEMLR